MSTRDEIRIHHAQSLLNGQDEIREAVRNGTYRGHAPIADEEELDQMIEEAQSDVEDAGLGWGYPENEKRGGLLGWLLG